MKKFIYISILSVAIISLLSFLPAEKDSTHQYENQVVAGSDLSGQLKVDTDF